MEARESSMTKKISQRSAIKLKRRVKELEALLDHLKQGWEGTTIDSWTMTDLTYARVKTASTLDYTIILRPTYCGTGVDVKAVKL